MGTSKLRPETQSAGPGSISIPNDTALFLIRDSVARRNQLIFGQLHSHGQHCAIGAFWADNPKLSLNVDLIDEVAAVNDSVPATATPHERWKKVNSWLRFKIASLTKKAAKDNA